jgi:hypothetical protein
LRKKRVVEKPITMQAAKTFALMKFGGGGRVSGTAELF